VTPDTVRPAAPAAAPAAVRVAVLGAVVGYRTDGELVEPAGITARALLAALALAAPDPRSIDALADDVWGDDRPQNPRGALQTLVSRIRSAVGIEVIRSDPSGYSCAVASDLSCAVELRDAANALPSADPTRLALIDRALALWRGEPGADLGGAPVAGALADAAATLRAALATDRAHALVALGRASEAADALSPLAAAHPYDEALHVAAMSALAASGRAGEALAVFAALRTRLRDDLGASPGAEASALNARLLRGNDASRRVRVGLRAGTTSLIGRDADLVAVRALLDRGRLVTILGTGGLGKTRLAHAVAGDSDAPAVVVVPLAGVRSDDDVAPAIANVLGISESTPGGRLGEGRPRPDLRARTIAQLSEHPTLLVLDNCEQVVGGVATWTADMLAAVPGLRVLTTSRTPLSIAAEAVYALAPLQVGTPGNGTPDTGTPGIGTPGIETADDGVPGDAVRLFLERAAAVRPDARMPRDVVTRLCTHLDGLPLAIELAAARVRTMTPEQIEARLQNRFALLTTGDRTAPARHRTLEAVIEWSWDLLDAEAQQALVSLSLLPAGFSARTAAGVLREASVDDVLDRLVSQSLLIVADEPTTGDVRFRMLETVREFGLSRLEGVPDDGERLAEARAAVTAWAVDFAASRVDDVFDVDVFGEVHAEQDNLIVVLRRALDDGDDATAVLVFALLAQSWIARGGLTELQAFGPAAFDASGRVDPAAVPATALAIVLVLGALVLGLSGEPGAARAVARVRMLRRRHPEIPPLVAAVVDLVADAPSAAQAGPVIERMCADVDPMRALVGEIARSQLAENDGEIAIAMVAARRAWELARRLGAVWMSATAAANAAQLAGQSAQPEEALRWLDRATAAFAMYGAADPARQEAWTRGGSLLSLGRIDEATEVFTELAGMRELTDDGLELAAMGWFGLAEVARAEGDPILAVTSYERAMGRFTTGDQRASPMYLLAISAFVSSLVLDASLPADPIEMWARRLRARAIAVRRIRPEFVDRPVLGAVLLGWSAWASTVPGQCGDGLEALALAEALGARQDLPSLHVSVHLARAAQTHGADAVARARAAASALSPDDRVARGYALLARP
jgi:predicted ATPase/DNA-binding SARP family transcriptional activator